MTYPETTSGSRGNAENESESARIMVNAVPAFFDEHGRPLLIMLWLALARAIHIAASILLAGLFAFRLIVLAPVASRYGRIDRFQPRFKDIWSRLALVAWSTVVVSAVVSFGVMAASISGAATLLDVDGETLQTVLLETQFGRLWACRLGCCLILGILLFSGASTAGTDHLRLIQDSGNRPDRAGYP